ncbi:MAG: triose-phosphate isomerase [Myxococcota bacterium]
MARVPFVCGNWKMNRTPTEAGALASSIIEALGDFGGVQVAVGPPFVALDRVANALGQSGILLAAQDVHWEDDGAFTGAVSTRMLEDLCVSFVIVGHSERRTLFGETDEECRKKVDKVLASGLNVILCVGETLEQREANQTLEVVGRQLQTGLAGVNPDQLAHVVVAYEPVWAIGTGRTATPDQAQEVHAFIRSRLAEGYGSAGEAVRIQYGGSVKPDNAAELFAQPDIDGGLIGGASLKADAFAAIVKAARGLGPAGGPG